MRLLAIAVLLASPLVGCIGADEAVDDATTTATGLLEAAATPLWDNPQTAPHPAFGFPTLSHPATGASVPAYWVPIAAAPLPSTISGIVPMAQAEGLESGAGMSVFGSIAVVPGYSADTAILDISDPLAPKLLSLIPEERHRNVDFIAYPSGRLVAVFSTGSGVLPVWDITDPVSPVRLAEMEPTSGTHKVNVVPGTPIVYNANSNGGGDFLVQPRTRDQATGITEIFDLSDPEAPVHVQDWQNGFGCHHIYFWISSADERYRAICAGIEMTQIWDISDPRNPTVVVDVPMQHGNPMLPSTSLSIESFSHFSILNQDGTVLIVGDESGGGGFPPGCAAHAGTPLRDAATPLGAIWFYDVTDETSPRLMGWFSPGITPMNGPDPADGIGAAFYSCTAHHGRLVPDPAGRDLLAMAFYRSGVVLVDFTDPSAARMVDQFADGTNTWEVQYYNGYLFTGDLARGMDVLGFE